MAGLGVGQGGRPWDQRCGVHTAGALDERHRWMRGTRVHSIAEHAGRRAYSAGFWFVACGFATVMSFGTVPTPLYVLYQARDHLSATTVTLVFAAYAVGVLLSLFLLGHFSDVLGRRRVLLPAVYVAVVADLCFLFWSSLPGLIVARVLTGVSVGLIATTATAYLAELHRAARPGGSMRRAEVVATAANLGGLGLGPVVAGALADLAPRPLQLPYWIYLVLLLVMAGLMSLAPETIDVPEPRPPYRVRRIDVPAAQRRRFLAEAASAFVSFALFGLFAALGPSFVLDTLHEPSHTVGGLAATTALGSAAVAQALVRERETTARRTVGPAFAALLVGLGIVVVAVWSGALTMFLAGAVVGGAGAGLAFAAAVKAVADSASSQNRADALSGLFLAAYLGITLPVVGLGAATQLVSQPLALTAFAVVMAAATVAAGLVAVSARVVSDAHSGDVTSGTDRYCRLTDRPLSVDEVLTAVTGPGQGGTVVFIGTVRDHNNGKSVTRLEYEAYPSLALKVLTDIIRRCEATAPGVRVAVAHRTGRLEIGEPAVVLAAAAPHRAEAFEAARACIELLKEEVPIWKKEFSPDGAEWIGTGP
ncbi:MFS transporter [Streptomyces cellulosae]|uniref:MFS transporter n=1 Tax=Streptomyces sp. enrichment culture TaxID=1795815 RepID=UPI003085A186|nr:MFS transporter [Streptomyces cellulosae]WSB83724.1 MFS transporter [Streptomyces cellulosae]